MAYEPLKFAMKKNIIFILCMFLFVSDDYSFV